MPSSSTGTTPNSSARDTTVAAKPSGSASGRPFKRWSPAENDAASSARRAAARLAEEAASFSAGLQRLKGRPLALPLGFAATVVSRALLFGVVPVLLLGMGWRGDVGALLFAGALRRPK